MKALLVLLMISPAFCFAQILSNAVSISGGAEYHDSKTHAWDIDVAYHRQFHKSTRFWSEFGLNYSILEYKGDSGIKLDTDPNSQIALGLVYYPGYIKRESIHYSKTSALRIQAGVNYTILGTEKIKLSAGLNIVNQLMLRQREHGQNVFVPYNTFDTLEMIDIHYYSEQNLSTAKNAITIHFQPHLDMSLRISDKLWFTSRLAYYWRVLPNLEHSRAQLNLGLRFEW